MQIHSHCTPPFTRLCLHYPHTQLANGHKVCRPHWLNGGIPTPDWLLRLKVVAKYEDQSSNCNYLNTMIIHNLNDYIEDKYVACIHKNNSKRKVRWVLPIFFSMRQIQYTSNRNRKYCGLYRKFQQRGAARSGFAKNNKSRFERACSGTGFASLSHVNLIFTDLLVGREH